MKGKVSRIHFPLSLRRLVPPSLFLIPFLNQPFEGPIYLQLTTQQVGRREAPPRFSPTPPRLPPNRYGACTATGQYSDQQPARGQERAGGRRQDRPHRSRAV